MVVIRAGLGVPMYEWKWSRVENPSQTRTRLGRGGSWKDEFGVLGLEMHDTRLATRCPGLFTTVMTSRWTSECKTTCHPSDTWTQKTVKVVHMPHLFEVRFRVVDIVDVQLCQLQASHLHDILLPMNRWLEPGVDEHRAEDVDTPRPRQDVNRGPVRGDVLADPTCPSSETNPRTK